MKQIRDMAAGDLNAPPSLTAVFVLGDGRAVGRGI
jgi:hypothetical protein